VLAVVSDVGGDHLARVQPNSQQQLNSFTLDQFGVIALDLSVR
jgi:hypothetical protein